MKLFEFENWQLKITEEAYALKPFKAILNNDKSKDKSLALRELAFVWFFADIKSDYAYILNEKDKESELIKDLELPKDWKKTKMITDAIDFYKERSKTVSSVILDNSLFIANTISNKMRKIISEEDDMLSIKEMDTIATGLSKMPGIVTSLQKLEQTVLKEQVDKNTNVGSQQKALFEDGI